MVVRSQVASARVTSIDTHAALDSPGVLAVYTGKDLAADGLRGACTQVHNESDLFLVSGVE